MVLVRAIRATHPLLAALACALAAAGALAASPANPDRANAPPAKRAAGAAASARPATDDVPRRVLVELNRERVARGAAPLSSPGDLQKAAELRARDVAAMPYERRMNRPSLGGFLARQGIAHYAAARERFMMLGGYEDAAAQLLRSWKDYDEAWTAAMSPRSAQVGIGWSQAADGSWIFLAIFLDPLPKFATDRVESMERDVFDAVNRERASHGLPALSWNAAIAAVARGHSQDMAGRRYFDHETPDGLSPADRVRGAGLSYRRVAENIARNQGALDPVDTAVGGWMKSPGHRANILDPVPTSTGVGIAVDDAGMVYLTQLFFAPP